MASCSRTRLLPALGLVLALGLVPVLSGCDSTSTGGPVFADLGIRTTTFTPRINDFVIDSEGFVASYTLQTSQLTSSVVQDGVVLVYARGDLFFVGQGVQNTWTALPYTVGVEGQGAVDFTVTYAYSFGVNNLYLDVVSSLAVFGTDVGDGYIPNDIPFRLVTIPGHVARSTSVDFSDYDAVKRAFGFED